MHYHNSSATTIEEIVELTNNLAKSVMFDRIVGRPVAKDSISALLRIAIMLHENGIVWPSLLREVISWQVDLVNIDCILPSSGELQPQQNSKPRDIVSSHKQDGPLRGHIDACTREAVVGWAQDLVHLERPVTLEILRNEQIVGQVLSEAYRSDLELANIGSGKHSFTFYFNSDDFVGEGAVIVRRKSDRAILGMANTTK